MLTQDNHPVMYISRLLTSSERNYSNIEREALAIVWAVERAKKLLLGKRFTLQTDHQPLKYIFCPNKNLSKTASARLIRWTLKLSAFDYDIEFVPGRSLNDADALSRLNFSSNDLQIDTNHADEILPATINDGGLVTRQELKTATQNCSLMRRVKQRIRSGRWGHVSQAERPFKMQKTALSVDDDLVIYGSRIVPPLILRRRILESAHDEIHPSYENTRAHITKEFWWPNMDREIRQFIDRCNVCAESRPVLARQTHTWPEESIPWSRVHMDHCEIRGVGLLLVLSDAFSGWPEAIRVPDKSSATVLKVLRTIFARNGVPLTLVSDNAPEFKSAELSNWLKSIGCREIHSPPYNPSSNGQAERLVRSLKDALRTWNKTVPFDNFLQKLLLTVRTSRPSGSRSASPDILMWGRRLRHPLTMVEQVGDPIWLRANPAGQPTRAKFVVQHGWNTALVTGEDNNPGELRLAHRNQWSYRPAEPTEISEDPGMSNAGTNDRDEEETRNNAQLDGVPVTDTNLQSFSQSGLTNRNYDLRPRKHVNYRY